MVVEARTLVAATLLVVLAVAPAAAAEPVASAYVGGKPPPSQTRADTRFCWALTPEGANLSSDACWKQSYVPVWWPGHGAQLGELVVGAVILGEEVCYMVDEGGTVQECAAAFCDLVGTTLRPPWCEPPRLAPGALP